LDAEPEVALPAELFWLTVAVPLLAVFVTELFTVSLLVLSTLVAVLLLDAFTGRSSHCWPVGIKKSGGNKILPSRLP